MFKRSNIFIWLLISIFTYFFLSYSNDIGKYLTADVFRTDTTIAWDIYYTDYNSKFDIFSNFESDSGNLSFVLTRDDTKIKFDTNKIKSDYPSNIENISENMIKLDIKKDKPFWIKANLLHVDYTWPTEYINISDAKMTYASWSVDLLAITRITQ